MPCIAEFPQLEKLAGREKELGFRFFGLEVRGYLKMMRDIVRDKKSTLTILIDDRRFARDVLMIPGTPTTFVVDAEGRIRCRLVGAAPRIDDIIVETLSRI